MASGYMKRVGFATIFVTVGVLLLYCYGNHFVLSQLPLTIADIHKASRVSAVKTLNATYVVPTAARNGVNQKILVIMTQTRSGSSFTGEIFAATDNSLYLYEPLYPYGLECQFPSEKEFLLTQLLDCDFNNLKDIYSRGFKLSGWGSDLAGCMKTEFCFAFKSPHLIQRYRKICMTKLAKAGQKLQESQRKCGYPLRQDIVAQVCRSSSLLITKVNRVCTVEEMENVYRHLKAKNKDVYVLHMLRDVRSITSSNLKLQGMKQLDRTIDRTINRRCTRQRHNVVLKDRDIQGYSMFADGRYMRIRYEDLATNATGAAEKVFHFMGRSLPPEVVSNIVNYLHPSRTVLQQIQQGKNVEAKVKRLSQEYKNAFGVVRDPQKILNEWRNLVPFDRVKEIQQQCGDVLKEMGYVIFPSEEEMKNLTIPSFKDVSAPNFIGTLTSPELDNTG